MSLIELLSCGGGRQSAGVIALIAQGRLPKPHHVCMVRLEGEVATVWPYVDAYLKPALATLGVPFTAIERAEYATKDFWGGKDGDSILIPVYSNQSGEASKLPEYCSGEWKREVVLRWAARQGWKALGVNMWVNISHDERHRRRAAKRQWMQPVYPLLDMIPMHVSGCLAAVEAMGWPEPPRSRCHWCPNQSDAEWAELTPAEWESACKLDEDIRLTDPHAFLHKQMIPLRMVTLNPKKDDGLFSGGCSAGMCY